MSHSVELDGIGMRFGTTRAVSDVSFTVGAGEFFSILGPSGCGKTTILRMIAGFLEPTEGRVLIGGRDMRGLGPNQRPTAMIFQSLALFPLMPVWENIAFGLEARGMGRAERRKRADDLLRLIALEGYGDRMPGELSGGQRQRVAIARALAVEPGVLLLDEPLSALDRKMREQMQVELIKLQRQVGITFVLVTHDQEEALVMSDRIAVMFEGEIAQLDGPEALYARPATRRVADFIGVMNFLPARILGEQAGTATVEVPGLGVVDLPERQISRANPDDEGPTIGFRPETMTLVGPTQTHSQPRETNATIDEVVYYGDMTYYDLRLDGAAAMDGKARPVRISMRNVFGRDVQEVGTRTRLAWSPGSLVLFR